MATASFARGVGSVFLAMVGVAGLLPAQTQESAVANAAPASGPETIRQTEPHFYVRADVDHLSRAYREGDSLAVTVTSEVDGFAYVLYKQADGKVFQIFPNTGQADNRIKAGAAVTIPSAANKSLFRWRVGPPFGTELIKVIVSKEPLKGLDDPDLRQKWFNPVSARQVGTAKQALDKQQPAAWGEHQVEITTYARNAETQPAGTRRYGAFFGLSHFEFNAEAKEAHQGKWEPDRIANASGATTMAKVLAELGDLAAVKTYTDAQATRAQMEETITRWLPSVSRPGDTVFIYFCTHGDRITGLKGGGEYTYYILPHEYVDVAILVTLQKQLQAGNLAPARKPRYDAWVQAIQDAGARTNEEVDRVLVLKTCITDDLMGRWLQALDGRQVVVIFETCHSGGFGKRGAEKALAADPADEEPFRFEFLQHQVSRLKDLGQSNATVLSACAGDESSYAVRASETELAAWGRAQKSIDVTQLKERMPVMTYQLVDALLRSTGPLSLEDAHHRCRDGMKQYFDRINDLRRNKNQELLKPHAPHLFDVTGKAVYLRP